MAKLIKLEDKLVGGNNPSFIIVEIGKNFIQTEENKSTEEYLQNAKDLVDAAMEVGADAVKFQIHNLEDEQVDISVESPHFKGGDRYKWINRVDSSTPIDGFWKPLKEHCDKRKIIFFATPFSRGAAIKINKLVSFWKVGSGDILDFVMLDYMTSTGKPIIISTGMTLLEEIDKAVGFLKKRTDEIIILHCVSKYPCSSEDLNLKTIDFLKKRYDLSIGFSDHSLGYDSAVAAANMGAVAIEKHFTFDRNFFGPDHKISMLASEFKIMVDKIRKGGEINLADYGKEAKILQEGEFLFRPIFRKTLVAGSDIPKGIILTKEMIYAMRPQGYLKGFPSEDYELVLGKKTVRDHKKYDPIVI